MAAIQAELINEFQEFQAFREAKEKSHYVGGGNGLVTKAPLASQSGQVMHGPTGLFSQRGLNPEVFSAMLQPYGLGAILPAQGTVFTNPQFAILAGQEADSGTEPTDSCGDPVRAGFRKMCSQTAQFGFLRKAMDTIDPSNLIKLLNRSEFTDLSLQGDAVNNNTGLAPAGNFNNPSAVLNNSMSANLSAVATSFIRDLGQQLWQGTVTGNTNGRAEFPGLDAQITTGHVDSVTNTLCPAADSDVKDFNFSILGKTGQLSDIVTYLSMLEFFVTSIARDVNVTATWVISMRPELWQELTDVWPISYNTNRGTLLSGNTQVNVLGDTMIAQRDQMRRSMTIEINAHSYQVVLDNGINEQTNITTGSLAAGQYASDIYFIPMTVNGYSVTRMEYLNYSDLPGALSAMGIGQSNLRFWTNAGRYLWTVQDTRECFDVSGRTEMRVICQTPYLAGRISNVGYEPLQHLRSPYTDSPYFVNGGVSTRTDFSDTNAVWA